MSTATAPVLRRIATAFLNATIMLLIILAIVGIILINKVQNFTTDTVAAASQAVGQEKTARITRGIDNIRELSGKVGKVHDKMEKVCAGKLDNPALAELKDNVQDLNSTVSNLNNNINDIGKSVTRAAIETTARALKRWLGVAKEPPAV